MADLIGTATIRVDMPTTAAVRQIRRFATQGEGQLRGLQNRISTVAREMRSIGDRTVRVTVDDRTRAGATAVRTAVADLQRLGPVRIPVQINDGTRRGATAVQTTVARLQRLGPVKIPVTIDDQTRASATATTTALARLRALGPVRIPVQVVDGTRRGVRAVQTAVAQLRRLSPVRISADIDVDAAATTTASAALRDLQQAARGTARALGTLATRATTATAALVALGAAARTLRGDMDDLDGSIRRTGAGMTGLRGRLGTVSTSASSAGSAMDKLKTAALLLSPALVPIAAQAIHILPLAGAFGAAAGAVAAFGVAVAGQIGSLSEAADAEKKAADAADKYGARSKQAAEAQAAHQKVLAGLPPATRKAAAGLTILRDQYRSWSDALAADTMPVVTKSFAVFGAVLPKLTPVVKGASGELSRFMTILAGGVQTRGFDRVMDRFAQFSSGVLKRANDGLIHFMRTLDTGKASGAFAQVMEYARENGPLVRDVLSNVSQALGNLLEAASNVGPGLLTVVNALAGIVAALPPGAITVFLQVAIAIKAVRLAAAGFAAVGPAVTAFATAIGAMRAAAAGASGVLPRLAAGFMALSRAARIAVAGTGIGLLVIALTELAQMGRQAPPDVDKLTGSLARLGKTGKTAGEAAKAFGADLGGLYGKVQALTDPGTADKVQQWVVSLGGLADWDSTPVKEAKENLDAIDEALAGLVKNGQADLAAAALKRLTAEYGKGGRDTKQFTKELDGYKAAIEDAKFEQELAAEAMGLFGQQAQATAGKLAEQKASADGLRQAIQALNDVNRSALGGMIGFEASVDAAAKAAKENAGSLRMINGELDLSSPKAQAAATALNDLAAKTDEAAGAARESGSSWATVNGIYDRGRQKLVESAMQMGLTRKEAKALADQILKTPDKTARLKGDIQDLDKKVDKAKKDIKSIPPSKVSQMKGTISDLEKKIKDAKARIKSVPASKRSDLRANINDLERKVRSAKSALSSIKSRSVTITAFVQYKGQSIAKVSAGRLAAGGRVKRYASGGPIQSFPDGGYVQGPGTPTSDSVLALMGSGATARVADTEYVVRGAAVRHYGVRLFDALNAMQLPAPKLAGGGMVGAGADAGAGLAAGLGGAARGVEAAARALAGAVTRGVREELQISSPSRAMKALAKDVGKGFIQGLTDSRDKIKAVSKDLAADVRAAFSGRKESNLIKMINRETSELLTAAKKRDAVEKKISDAKKFAADTAARARDTGSLARIVSPEFAAPRMVEQRMKSALAQIKAFTANVDKLRKKGVSKALMRQILELGPEQGGEFAKALAGADAATIKRYNTLQSDLDKQSKKLGNKGADMLYDSGKKAGEGFLTGLKAQQKQIEKLMLDIAKGMQKSIRKALGIKSPSRVMWNVGTLSMDGLRAGLLQQVPAVQRVMDRVAGAVATGTPASLPPAAHGGMPSGRGQQRPTGAGGPRELHVHVHNTGVIGSQFEVENWLARSLDHLSRTGRLPAPRAA